MNHDKVLYRSSVIMGIVAFIAIYGINVLNPVYDDCWGVGT